jgi:hypothetical protein
LPLFAHVKIDLVIARDLEYYVRGCRPQAALKLASDAPGLDVAETAVTIALRNLANERIVASCVAVLSRMGHPAAGTLFPAIALLRAVKASAKNHASASPAAQQRPSRAAIARALLAPRGNASRDTTLFALAASLGKVISGKRHCAFFFFLFILTLLFHFWNKNMHTC